MKNVYRVTIRARANTTLTDEFRVISSYHITTADADIIREKWDQLRRMYKPSKWQYCLYFEIIDRDTNTIIRSKYQNGMKKSL